MKKERSKRNMKKKLLVFIALITFVMSFFVVVPKTKAAGDFNDDAHYIGYIAFYDRDSSGTIVGAYVFIINSSVPSESEFWFHPTNFQPDILTLQNDLIGKLLIWNPFDDRGYGPYSGCWWLLMEYESIADDVADAYENGYIDGEQAGYTVGYDNGYDNGYDIGYDEGLEDGLDIGYEDGFEDGYNEGFDDAYSEIIISDDYMLGYNDGFKDGEKSRIAQNNQSFYSSIEKWLVPAIIVILVVGGIMSISALKRREV